MAGTKAGGKAAALTNMRKYDAEYLEDYGMTFYQYNGHLGGSISRTGGFASDKVSADGLTGPQRARIAGVKGGRISKRPKRQEA